MGLLRLAFYLIISPDLRLRYYDVREYMIDYNYDLAESFLMMLQYKGKKLTTVLAGKKKGMWVLEYRPSEKDTNELFDLYFGSFPNYKIIEEKTEQAEDFDFSIHGKALMSETDNAGELRIDMLGADDPEVVDVFIKTIRIIMVWYKYKNLTGKVSKEYESLFKKFKFQTTIIDGYCRVNKKLNFFEAYPLRIYMRAASWVFWKIVDPLMNYSESKWETKAKFKVY